LKFTRQGTVTVRAWSHLTEGDETSVTLHISVTDTGVGLAAEHHAIIFEPFRQVRGGEAPALGGTGLGLSITKRLTHLLKGEVRLKSEVGEGSTFSFEFEGVAISAAIPEEDRPTSPDEDLDRLRPSLILVVDDVPLNRELMYGYFEGTRHRLLYASGGREAVAMAEKFHPDIIFMDMRMPDIDGHEARALIRDIAEVSAIPMVAMTASSLLSEEVNLRKVFEGYLRKPITRKAMFDELQRLLPKEGGRATPSPVPFALDAAHVPADPGVWRALVQRLRELESEVWPKLSKSMGVREMETFARALLAEADATACGPLADYAGKLLAEVQAIDIHAQEKTMKTFPVLVAAIDRRTEEGQQ
jgi:CheY-like chemotaxis protein